VPVFDLENAPLLGERVGQKAKNLAILRGLGLPVPPAFVITADEHARWQRNGERLPEDLVAEIREAAARLADKSGGPRLVSVRSGATVSMPGAMSTIVNVGVSSRLLDAWLERPERFHADSYARFLRGLLRGLGRDDLAARAEQPPESSEPREALLALRELAKEGLVPDDPLEQILAAIHAVFLSWDSPGARAFRRAHFIGDDLGTAVLVQKMVFGNKDRASGTGLVSTRDPTTGERGLAGRYLLEAQGEAMVGAEGPARASEISELARDIPAAFAALTNAAEQIEAHFAWPQDLEITIESGELWLLQARSVPLTARALLRVVVDNVEKGLLTPKQAVARLAPIASNLESEKRFTFDTETGGRLLGQGLTASPGIVIGPLFVEAREDVPANAILIQSAFDPVHQLGLMKKVAGLLSLRGGTTSHAATLARLMRKPYVTGLRAEIDLERRQVRFGDVVLKEGEIVSVDAASGSVYAGELSTEIIERPPELEHLRVWQRAHGSNSTWQAGCYLEGESTRPNYPEIVRSIVSASRWRTAKALATELLRALLPAEVRIPQFVVSARDPETLRARMIAGLEKGHWIGLRPCYSEKKLGKGTWQMGLRTPSEVDEYLRNPEFRGLLKTGGYPSWIEDPTLEEIIVVWDPPGKGLPELASRQFALSISCLPNAARVEIILGTAQVRTLESAEPERLVHLTMELDHAAPKARGPRSTRYGSAHVVDGVVDPFAANVARRVGATVFKDWWDAPFELPHVMCALDSEYGLHSLEFQGQVLDAEGAVEYMLLFDAKGAEESHFLAPRARR
jgi:phosphohistidine swiveling domain-containing protein